MPRGCVECGRASLKAVISQLLSDPMSTVAAEPDICHLGGKGKVLPLFGTEHSWSQGIQITVYVFGLLWLFMGVAIISDVFMAPIEKITSSALSQEARKKVFADRISPRCASPRPRLRAGWLDGNSCWVKGYCVGQLTMRAKGRVELKTACQTFVHLRMHCLCFPLLLRLSLFRNQKKNEKKKVEAQTKGANIIQKWTKFVRDGRLFQLLSTLFLEAPCLDFSRGCLSLLFPFSL